MKFINFWMFAFALLSSIILCAGETPVTVRKQLENFKITVTYPEWKLKAVAFSYDDGNIADRKLVEIFNKYKVKGTFHIPSAWLWKKPEKRVKESEIKTLYAGHEVSGHGSNHTTLILLSRKRVEKEIDEDIAAWGKITGKPMIGYAYPFGRFNDQVVDVLRSRGLLYARTCRKAENFDLPVDFLRWAPHAHHRNRVSRWGDRYLKFQPERMSVLLVWGHSYEFDRAKNWHIIESFCRQISGKPEIFYATMGEIALYVNAVEKMELSADKKVLTNRSAQTVWFTRSGEKFKLAPGETFKL